MSPIPAERFYLDWQPPAVSERDWMALVDERGLKALVAECRRDRALRRRVLEDVRVTSLIYSIIVRET